MLKHPATLKPFNHSEHPFDLFAQMPGSLHHLLARSECFLDLPHHLLARFYHHLSVCGYEGESCSPLFAGFQVKGESCSLLFGDFQVRGENCSLLFGRYQLTGESCSLLFNGFEVKGGNNPLLLGNCSCLWRENQHDFISV